MCVHVCEEVCLHECFYVRVGTRTWLCCMCIMCVVHGYVYECVVYVFAWLTRSMCILENILVACGQGSVSERSFCNCN